MTCLSSFIISKYLSSSFGYITSSGHITSSSSRYFSSLWIASFAWSNQGGLSMYSAQGFTSPVLCSLCFLLTQASQILWNNLVLMVMAIGNMYWFWWAYGLTTMHGSFVYIASYEYMTMHGSIVYIASYGPMNMYGCYASKWMSARPCMILMCI